MTAFRAAAEWEGCGDESLRSFRIAPCVNQVLAYSQSLKAAERCKVISW